MQENTTTSARLAQHEPAGVDLDKLEALARAATRGPWKRSERLNGPFWHISSDYTVGGEPCKSGKQSIAAVHGESKKAATAYTTMFEANADFIAAANPATVLALIDLARRAQPRVAEQADQQAAPEAPADDQHEAKRSVIIQALSQHRMVQMYEVEDDGSLGNSYSLIDRLCLDDASNIESGVAEVEAIADAVLKALEQVQ